MTTPRQRKRYRLHQIIKHHFRYEAEDCIVMIPPNFSKENYPKKVVRAMEQLKKMNYLFQIELF